MRLLKFILAFLPLSLFSFGQDNWVQRDSVNGPPRSVSASFVLQNEGYVLGGLDDFTFKRKMYSYNYFQNDWDDEESIGGPNGDGLERGSACAFALEGKGYICLGQGQTMAYMNDLWQFDPDTKAWSQKADFMGTPRRQAVSFTIGTKAYVGTGQDLSGLRKDFYSYDALTNSWVQLNDFPGTARKQAVAFEMGVKGWLGTGDDGTLKKDFWMYDPASDNWIQKTDFPGSARAGAVGWSTHPTCFIATGEDVNFEYKKDVWEYNYYSNSWTQRVDLIGPGRKNAIAFVLDGIAFVGTGYNGVFLDDFYAYFGIVGINEQEVVSSSVYPNPVSNELTISTETNLSDSQVLIYSVTGKMVYSSTMNSSDMHTLNVSRFDEGAYFYRILDESRGKMTSGKFVVKK